MRQLQNRLSNLIGFSAEEKTLFFAGENVGEHFEQNKFYLTKDQFEIVQKNANAQIMELTKETYQKISEIMYIGNDPDAISIYPHLIHDLNKKFEQEKNSIQEKVQEAKSYIVSEDFFDFNALNSLNSVLRAKKQQLSALQEI